MTAAPKEWERQRLLEIAQEYRERGYQVAVEPRPDSLPGFLADYRPDMIAQGEDENVVVEVRSYPSLQSQELVELARAVQRTPSWRFELVVTNPQPAPHTDPDITEPTLTEAQIRERLDQADALLHEGRFEAALMTIWSAAEAGLRLASQRKGIPVEGESAQSLIKSLFALGMLEERDYDTLLSGMRLRNSVAHGYQTSEPASGVSDVIHIVQRLLKEGAGRIRRLSSAS